MTDPSPEQAVPRADLYASDSALLSAMMHALLVALRFISLGGMTALAVEAEFEITAPRTLLITPVMVANDSLIDAKFEPTKHELRFDDTRSTEQWEQNFQLAARLPVAETFTLRQEFRSGLQNETVLGQELSTVFRDALAMLEKTSAELRASEALRIAASVQDQWLANNGVPFAEIVTYGVEAKFTPTKATTVKLQLDWQDREEFAATQSEQESYRLSLEQELVPKRLTAATGASLVHADDDVIANRESLVRKMDGSLKWTPLAATSVTLGAELSTREAVALVESGEAYAVKLQQQLFAGSKLELQGGYELHTRSPLDDTMTKAGVWNLGANSDFALREDWNAGVGVRYRVREEPAGVSLIDEISFTLSLKGKF